MLIGDTGGVRRHREPARMVITRQGSARQWACFGRTRTDQDGIGRPWRDEGGNRRVHSQLVGNGGKIGQAVTCLDEVERDVRERERGE